MSRVYEYYQEGELTPLDQQQLEYLEGITIKNNKNMKQTAVEWLEKEIENISIQVFDGFLTFREFMEEREELCKQAKEMEKEQIMDAFHKQTQKFFDKEEAEQYYNETFKSE